MYEMVLGLSQNSTKIPRIILHRFFFFNLVKGKGKHVLNYNYCSKYSDVYLQKTTEIV